MALVRLIYASRASAAFDEDSLEVLTRRSFRNNRLADITGALLYCDGIFIQTLEGPEQSVRDKFARIGADDRHYSVRELSCRRILGREFTNWGMSMLYGAKATPTDQARIQKMIDRICSAVVCEDLGNAANELFQDLSVAIRDHSALIIQSAA